MYVYIYVELILFVSAVAAIWLNIRWELTILWSFCHYSKFRTLRVLPSRGSWKSRPPRGASVTGSSPGSGTRSTGSKVNRPSGRVPCRNSGAISTTGTPCLTKSRPPHCDRLTNLSVSVFLTRHFGVSDCYIAESKAQLFLFWIHGSRSVVSSPLSILREVLVIYKGEAFVTNSYPPDKVSWFEGQWNWEKSMFSISFWIVDKWLGIKVSYWPWSFEEFIGDIRILILSMIWFHRGGIWSRWEKIRCLQWGSIIYLLRSLYM